ncbi:HMG box transcription factor BBX-like [Haliaeetus albicilla]|uniref:HMG box transcription factor BBX-like n=1 Tax=Haliaeetus albicilla TaxID=8969 RepID=UPI0037E94E7E
MYRALESVLQGGESRLQSNAESHLTAKAPGGHRGAQYKDACMKANRGYKWCPTANQPAKTQASTVTNRKKLWAFASDSAKALPSPRKVTRSDEMPQRNFRMADLTETGGLSMLLLAGEHALTAQEISSSASQPGVPGAVKQTEESALFQFAEWASRDWFSTPILFLPIWGSLVLLTEPVRLNGSSGCV